MGLAEPVAASLVQKAYLVRRADDAARRLQKFYRWKMAIPRAPEKRAHRRTHARVIPDEGSKIAA
eukprot:6192169-Pleurochrysis_carterae.AAC.5